MDAHEIAQLKAREEINWKTLRECADILCLPDESPSLLPEKIRSLQASLISEKQAKVERGEMVEELKEQSKMDSLVVGKLQAELIKASEDTALINRWEKGQWLIGLGSTGDWQAMGQTPGLIGRGFVGKSVRDVLRQIRDLT
jgi:hypothetical protein